jgi:hypothetical protein
MLKSFKTTTLAVVTAAATLLGSGAFAQDAYITQMGINNAAANYSEYTQGDNLQVITQSGDNLRSANFTRGSSSVAINYQLNSGNAPGSTMSSLIFQNGSTNTAIAVQDNNPTFGNNNRTYASQIIQEGTGNTGVNWNQTRAGAMAGMSIGSVGSPGTLTIAPMGMTAPSPVLVTTTLPNGSTIEIN